MSDKPEQILQKFSNEGKERYGDMFFLEQIAVGTAGYKIVTMTEKLAEELRLLISKADITNQVVSLDKDNSVGNYYRVKKDSTKLYNRPGPKELSRITENLPPSMITKENRDGEIIVNELMENELVRGMSLKDRPDWLAIAVCHDFENIAPKALGWVKLEDLEPLTGRLLTRPKKLISHEDAITELLGTPYHIGGKSRETGFDCSSFTQTISYRTKGLWLPKKAAWQALVGKAVKKEDILPGDLIFFQEAPVWTIEHVGTIYQPQSGKLPIIAHASRYSGDCIIEDLNKASWLNGKFRINNYRKLLNKVS